MDRNSHLVYSSDAALNRKCPKCKEALSECLCTPEGAVGSGGTYLLTGPDGVIEIQGDKREMIRGTLAKKGMTVKG